MNVEKLREKDGTVELEVMLEGTETEEAVRRAAIFAAYERKVEPDPQRQPAEVVREALGEEEAAFVIDEEVMKHQAPFAVSEYQIDMVGTPQFACSEHVQEGKPFRFRLTVVPAPAFELSSYDAVDITVPALSVTDEEVEEQIQALAKASAEQVADDSHDVVQKGDTVELAMETTQDGRTLRPLTARRRMYRTGTLSMPDGFDEAVIGMKVGETKTFDFEGPGFETDADGNPIMEAYTSTVTVNRILTDEEPEPDDAWAARIAPGCKTLADLREQVRSRLLAQRTREYDKQCERLAAGELAKRFEAKIPDAVYDAAMEEAKAGFAAQLKEQGKTLEEFLKEQQIEEQQMTMSLMMQVREQLTRQFALDAYANHENVESDDDDLNRYFDAIAPGKGPQARADFERDGKLYAAQCAARRLKANRLLVERATKHDAVAPAAHA